MRPLQNRNLLLAAGVAAVVLTGTVAGVASASDGADDRSSASNPAITTSART